MNAAAKLLNHGTLSRHSVFALFVTRAQLLCSLMAGMIFMSALSVIYTTNTVRDLHASLYQTRSEYSRLFGQQGQLLLERSTLAMQARVQRAAERTFNMIVPRREAVVMIHERD